MVKAIGICPRSRPPKATICLGSMPNGRSPFSLTVWDSAIQMLNSMVIMGVAGCGKSSLAAAIARDHGLALVEGDERHPEANVDKMRRGIPLTDADREGWLASLADELAASPQGLVVTCSALRRAYRERLRAAAPGLRFVYLEISRDDAKARVAARPGHFFTADMVDSQFATLEPPLGEAGVLRVDATAPPQAQRAQVAAWLQPEQTS
jgi:gluconokinase